MADSRFAPSQWETALLCNDVSHWLGASLDSALMSWYGHTFHITGIFLSSDDKANSFKLIIIEKYINKAD